ncbi:g4658 [Coccomyxa elongata]
MALSATPKVAELVVNTCIPHREAIKPAGLLQPRAPLQALLLEQAIVLEAWDTRQEKQTDALKHLLSELLRKVPEQVNLARTDSPSHRRGTACSEDGVSCGASSSEVSTAPGSPPTISMCQQHADNQQAQLPCRASSVPMDMLPGMPARLLGLRLGRLIGRGSFGRVYRGSWEGRPVAVKVMCHEGSAGDRLNTLHESLVAQQMKHTNVIATYRVHTVERPAGQEVWGLYRSASLGQTVRQWPLSRQPVVPFLPSEGCLMGQGYSLPAGRCLRAASRKMEGAAVAARSGNATSLAAAVSAAAAGALTLGKNCDAALMSPFYDTIEKLAYGCREAAMQPMTRIARHMSLDPAGCKRESVKTWWRSLSFGDSCHKGRRLPDVR